MMLSYKIDSGNAFDRLPALWLEFEQRYNVFLTLHDHVKLFVMPDSRCLLPARNVHLAPCCQYKKGKRLRCMQHCKYDVMREGETIRGPFRFQCWRGVVECVLPLFKDNELAATLFAGAFREARFPVQELPKYYQQRYMAMPLWTEERGLELAFALTLLGNALMQIAQKMYGEFAKLETGRKSKIKRFISHNIKYRPTLPDLAQHLELSNSRCSMVVKELFGQTFTKLLHLEQIKQAKVYLSDGELELKEVARLSGFQNEFYFNQVFRRYCNMPPGAYRKRSAQQV
ncbi:MAG: helix-turn-helix transcriptional regulator [Lentisphaerae bacterium]|nr:helix-turn-helix transcriptional regulator [Lentisphaerota bacterium]